jgi:hypothetical protein
MARLWGDPADGEICDACAKPITKQQLIMDGIVSTRSDKKLAQFHVRCFQFWGYGEARTEDVDGTGSAPSWYRQRGASVASAARSAGPLYREAWQMRFPGVAVILAIVGVLLVSSGGVPAGTTGPATAGPASAADAKPVVARSRPEVQRSILADRDKDPALGLVLLLGMLENRRGR